MTVHYMRASGRIYDEVPMAIIDPKSRANRIGSWEAIVLAVFCFWLMIILALLGFKWVALIPVIGILLGIVFAVDAANRIDAHP